MKDLYSLIKPSAIPSNIEWTLRAIMRMKGVRSHFSFTGFSYFCISEGLSTAVKLILPLSIKSSFYSTYAYAAIDLPNLC
jgi:hypothetical protein